MSEPRERTDRFDPMRREPIDDDLRRAFVADDAPVTDAPEFDAETIYRAAAGELPAAERLKMIDALSRDPELAEAWRLAVELQAAARRAEGAVAPVLPIRQPRATFRPGWVALAAMLLLVVGIGVRRQLQPEPTWRGQRTTHAIQLVGEPDASLSRRSATLRWRFDAIAAPASARISVTTETLDPVYLDDALDGAELTIPEAALVTFPVGTRFLWRVEARAVDGTPLTSPVGVFVLAD
jgi:hypothetical protein